MLSIFQNMLHIVIYSRAMLNVLYENIVHIIWRNVINVYFQQKTSLECFRFSRSQTHAHTHTHDI